MSRFRFCLVLGAIGVSGCGGSSLVPVEGTVILNGSPLADASVVLMPANATAPGPYVGKTDAQGRFALGPSETDSSGAEVGTYRLMITTVEPVPGYDENSPRPTKREVVPAAYVDGSQKFEVPEGGVRDAKIEMRTR